MASPGYLLYVLSLLLCGTASLGMSVSLDSNSTKPIIGKKAGRGPGLVSVLAACAAGLGASACIQPEKYSAASLGRVPSCTAREPSPDTIWIVLKYS